MTGSLVDVLPSVGAVLGVAAGEDRLGLAEPLAGVQRVAVVLVDGLGTALLPQLAPHAPLLADALAGSFGTLRQLSCTFPSTTPTSLVSLGTGVAPGEHGVLGFTVNVPGTERVLTHILWRDDPPPQQWQPVPTWFERAAAAGVDARVVLPGLFEGSGLTVSAYRGARFCGVAKGEDYAGRLIDELLAGPGLVYGYTAALDTAAHVFGIASAQWAAAAAKVDALLARVVAALPRDAALLVTADHGGLDVGPAGRVDVAADPRLADGLRVVAGEPRVRYLHVRDGAAADVRDTWQALLGPDAAVVLRDEAVDAGWFGPVRPEHRARIGDVIAVCRGDLAVFATDREPAQIAKLVGMHGADTPAEMAIPLLTVRG